MSFLFNFIGLIVVTFFVSLVITAILRKIPGVKEFYNKSGLRTEQNVFRPFFNKKIIYKKIIKS